MYTTGRIDAQELKDRIDMRDVVASVRNHPGKRAGDVNLYTCDYHDDRNPSMGVWEDHLFCFSCHTHADIYDYMQHMYNISFVEALQRLAGTAAVSPVTRKEKVDVDQRRSFLHDRLTYTKNELSQYRIQLERVEPYLTGRLITGHVIDDNYVGGDEYKRRYQMPDGEWLEFRCNRVALPSLYGNKALSINFRRDDKSVMANLAGQPAGIIDYFRELIAKEKTAAAEGKKVYSPEDVSPQEAIDFMYGKRYWKPKNTKAAVFGLWQLFTFENGKGEYIEDIDDIILTEGEMNALVAQAYGFTALAAKSHSMMKLLLTFKHAKRIFIVEDNDRDKQHASGLVTNAGISYARKLYQVLGSDPDWCRIIRLPNEYSDLNDLAKAGVLVDFLSERPNYIKPKERP